MPLNEADKKFLKGMIPHHRMALKMAATVIKEGQDMRVDALARKIREGQTEEIAEMQDLLAEVGEKPDGGGGAM